jgi:hypothetical protein
MAALGMRARSLAKFSKIGFVSPTAEEFLASSEVAPQAKPTSERGS